MQGRSVAISVFKSATAALSDETYKGRSHLSQAAGADQ
jgi:hypothetical protein